MEEYPHLPDYALTFINSLIKKGRTKSTIKRYYYDLLDFFAWVRVIRKNDLVSDFESLTKEQLEEYFTFLIEQREYSTATCKRILTVLKSLFHFLKQQGIINRNSIIDVDPKFHEDKAFHGSDFITVDEFEKLYMTLSSTDGLTERQLKYRHLLVKRNEAILSLLYSYGLTLQELSEIKMEDLRLTSGDLTISNNKNDRVLTLDKGIKHLISEYLNDIPASIRPRSYSIDHLFIAFDYQRGTFRFDYNRYEPKPLTLIAIQKMLRQEIRRSGIRSGISAHHLRRTAILNAVRAGIREEELLQTFGLKSPLTLQRYFLYLQEQEMLHQK